jgi:lipopolysaccharide export system protein LptA
LGQSGFSNGGEWRAEQLTRVEAREGVLVISKYGQTATGDWATFDVMASTVLMGDNVVVSVGKDGEAEGPRLKLDLTTGMYRFEIESTPVSPQPPAAQIWPQ